MTAYSDNYTETSVMTDDNNQRQTMTGRLKAIRETPAYREEKTKLALIQQATVIMRQEPLTREVLAQRMGMELDDLDDLLRGDVDMTVSQMVRLADALDCHISIALQPK